MKIALISTYAHPIALGLRYISSYLKTTGHDVVMLFMSSRRDTARVDYGAALLDDLASRLHDRDLIGVSLATATFHRARVLTEHIRQAGIRAPVVWGGVHSTMAAEECLAYADAACIGPGEEPVLQLVERVEAGRDPTMVPGLWFRAGGLLSDHTVRNAPGPLETRLDDLPFPDYELDTHWVAGRAALVPARPENMRGALHTLRVLTARGCPYHCTFCNNTALREVHGNFRPWVRLRSLDNVLAELRQARACFPTIRAINFVDDLFLVRSAEEIEAFADRYNVEIGVPLEIDAFPNTVTERKVRALARLPIQLVSMGIESASDDTLKNIYRRPTTLARIAEAIQLFHRYQIRTEYHYIVSNPYEPDRNVVETMRFIASHHRGPAVLRVFPLMFYPGTPLYQRARADSLVGAQDHAVYDYMGTGALEVAKHDYLAVWLRAVLNLRNVGVPAWVCHRVIDFATSRAVRKLLDRRWFCPAAFIGYQVVRKLVRNFVYQPFIRPLRHLRSAGRGGLRRASARWTVPKVNLAAARRDHSRAGALAEVRIL